MATTRFAKLALASMIAISCSLGGAAWAGGVPVQSATEEQKESASTAYLSAKEAFDARNFDEALSGFRASYDIVASPNARLMVVASLSELGRHAEAYEEVVPAIAEAKEAAATDPKYEGTVASLERARDDLRAKIGLLTVTVDPSVQGDVTLDGKTISPDRLGQPVAVMPGPHVVAVAGGESRDVEVQAGGDAAVALAPPSGDGDGDGGVDDGDGDGEGATTATGDWFVENRRTIAYAAGGVGVVGMVLFGAFGGLTLSTQSDLDEACGPQKICPPESRSDIDDGKTYQAVANAGLVIGIVGLTAGVGLFVWDVLDEGGEDEEMAGGPTMRMTVGAGHLGLEGSF